MRKLLALAAACCASVWGETPFHSAELVFPLEHWHNHSSAIVELPDGDLMVCWYNGSGERTADDVKVEGARLPKGSKTWLPRYTLADTPGFPDTNPTLFVDSRQRLWLLWPVVLANEWHTSLMKYRISTDYRKRDAPPVWSVSETMLFLPRNFSAKVNEAVSAWPPSDFTKRLLERGADKYFSRMGWMTRAHPLELPSGRILVPLYSDGYSFSLMALTDDGGRTWQTSEPLVSRGGIQPTIVRRKDGALVTYMRDNGPPPKRLHTSQSKDEGVTWSPVTDSTIPNPGSGMEAIVLASGEWAMIYNDLEKGRHSLAVSLSDDEGATWKWTRHLELDNRGAGAGSFHYPSIIQAREGSLHASYSYFLNHLPAGAARKSIKHAHFNVDWVKRGD
jgi:predicted neuraminidase